MTFAHSWLLNFLWLLPLVAAILFVVNLQKRRVVGRFAAPLLLPRLTARERGHRRFLKSTLVLTAFGLMLFALAGPRWGSHLQEVSRMGADMMILFDVSPSMGVADVEPSRLERAKQDFLGLLEILVGDRVGLVVFSGAAFVQCPLTLDYGALKMFAGEMKPDLIPVRGTNLGAAIDLGISCFNFESKTDKVMVLITDGEDNEGQGLDAARQAWKKGIKLFVLAVGERSGGPLPAEGGGQGFRKDSGGKTVVSRLDENFLKKLAATTEGTYVRSVAGEKYLDRLYFDGIKSKTDPETLKSGKIRVQDERYALFLFFALIILMLEGLIQGRGAKAP